jgi:hypothetical protein
MHSILSLKIGVTIKQQGRQGITLSLAFETSKKVTSHTIEIYACPATSDRLTNPLYPSVRETFPVKHPFQEVSVYLVIGFFKI